MKVLILTDYPSAWPYIPELIEQLEKMNIQVDVLDIFNFGFLTKKEKYKFNDNWYCRILFHIPIVNKFSKFFLINFFILKKLPSYDISNIHFLSIFYKLFLNKLKNKSKKIIVTIWGSDYYRVDNNMRNKLKFILDKVDAITFINSQTRDELVKYYHDYADKCYVQNFGMQSLEEIKRAKKEEEVTESKNKLNIPLDSFTICCGYNGKIQQQHEIILQSIDQIKEKLPKNTIILLPMTYGYSTDYLNKITDVITKYQLKYRLFTAKLSLEDIARLRLVTDIMINMQTTDQLSASVQEHLFAENIVISGSWLPYKVFEEKGIFFIKADNHNDLQKKIVYAVDNFSELKEKSKENSSIIYEFACWKNNIQHWIELYNNILRK